MSLPPVRARSVAVLAAVATALVLASTSGAGHDAVTPATPTNVFHIGMGTGSPNSTVGATALTSPSGNPFYVTAPTTHANAIWGRATGGGQSSGVIGDTVSADPQAEGVLGAALATGANAAVGVRGVSSGDTHLGAGVQGEHTSQQGAAAGVRGITQSTAPGAVGVQGEVLPNSVGIYSAGVRAINWGTSGDGMGVWASNQGTGWGTYSDSARGVGAYGLHLAATGTQPGTQGWTASATDLAAGVKGIADANGSLVAGVYGTSANGIGLVGVGKTAGLVSYNNTAGGLAALFLGNVHVEGTFTKSAGSFRIDHPLDPEHKYLQHSFVESPDMMNVYNGNIRTDRRGLAQVRLPRYFEALNRDFRYQLTIVGRSFAQALVWHEIRNNRFTIRTSKPHVKVSWLVTGIRKDAYANAHRIQPEIAKPANETASSALQALGRR